MKDKEFLYFQYNKINWGNQEKTKANSFINDYLIENVILNKKGNGIKLFDIGFGIGFFLRILGKKLHGSFEEIILEGCEPSSRSYKYFKSKPFNLNKVRLRTFNKAFLDVKTNTKFDFITAIYVFPHVALADVNKIALKIKSMLEPEGKFILVVTNTERLEGKLKSREDLLVKRETIRFKGEKYDQIWNYSDIPDIGRVLNCDREAVFYTDLFRNNGFKLDSQKDLRDTEFICTVLTFSKK